VRRAGTARLVAVPILIVLTAVIASGLPSTMRLQAAWFDEYQILAPRSVVSTPAAIVEIDKRSLEAYGQWPWPRPVLAQLIADINRHRPAAIGIDILMPEPDGLSLERLLTRSGNKDPALSRELATLASHDALLAQALAAAPTVLAVAGSATPTGAMLRAPLFAQVAVPRDAAAQLGADLPQYAGVISSLDQLDAAATGHGLISVDPVDGVFRRIPLVANVGGTLVPALAIELLRVAKGVTALRLFLGGPSILGIGVGDFLAPTEEDGAVRVYYSASDSRRFISAVDVLDGNVDPEKLAQKLVLIGVTGLGLADNKNTPIGVLMPGVEIHAQLLENLFDGTLLRRPAWASQVEAVVFLAFGILLVYGTPRWNPRTATLVAFGSLAVFATSGFLAFRLQRLLFDAAVTGVCLSLLFGLLLVLTLAETTRQRKALEQLVQREREQKARMAGELDAAKRVQIATLPRAELLRDDRRLDLAATMVPAREVGGDLYDFFRLDNRHLFFLVGDVAGKGLSASIFMAVSKALCKSTVLRTSGADIGELMAVANSEVSRDNPEMLFVTAFAGVLDLESGDLVYCNAGHENPFVAGSADAAVDRIEDGGGPPLCAVDDFVYRGAERRIRAGELLCLVSDGVTEAINAVGELYGGERVRELLQRVVTPEMTAGALVGALRADVDAFTAGAEVADDLTVMVLRWNGPGGRAEGVAQRAHASP
jgi:serine phosphatase RsbU (regulator of sigma subunit)/CHASE2 domain-containing sensor protein